MADNTDDKIRKAADSAMLMLVSRLSAPLLVAVCTWILTSVLGMKTDIATIVATLDGQGKRIEQLEGWRNALDAFAADGRPGVHR